MIKHPLHLLFISLIFSVGFSSCVITTTAADDDDDDKKTEDTSGKDSADSEDNSEQTDDKTDDEAEDTDDKQGSDVYYNLTLDYVDVLSQGFATIKGTCYKTQTSSQYTQTANKEFYIQIADASEDSEEMRRPKYYGLKSYIEGDAQYTALLSGLKCGETYKVQVYMTSAYGEYHSRVVELTVPYASADTDGEYESVDLGLSVRWATRNVGAKDSLDAGDTFAYGEIKGGRQNYSEETYLLKDYAEVMPDSITGDEQIDCASLICGEGWRLPTPTEARELVKKCKWEVVTNGTTRYVTVTGPNGNRICLPLAGHIEGTTTVHEKENPDETSGYYMTGTPSRYLHTYRGTGNSLYRSVSGNAENWWGMYVRPVKK